MKIAILAEPSLPTPVPESVSLLTASIADNLVRRGHDVRLYASGDSQTLASVRALYPKGVFTTLQERGAGDFRSHLAGQIESDWYIWAIRDAVAWGADVLHGHHRELLNFVRLVDVPFVLTHHLSQGKDPIEQVVENTYLEWFNFFPSVTVVMVSHAQASRYPAQLRTRVVHNGIDVSSFELSRRPRDYLLFVGRVSEEKGAHVAIDVAKETQIPLKIAGSAGDRLGNPSEFFCERIQPAIESSNGRIEHVGIVDHPTKVRLYGGAKAVLIPSIWEEAFGMVAIEAMACGTPVIAFSTGGLREIIRDGQTGYLVSSTAEMVERVLQPTTALVPEQLREEVNLRFSVEVMAKRYEEVYLEAIAHARNPKVGA